MASAGEQGRIALEGAPVPLAPPPVALPPSLMDAEAILRAQQAEKLEAIKAKHALQRAAILAAAAGGGGAPTGYAPHMGGAGRGGAGGGQWR